jgi:peptidoglycan L-alanyl-D-glutamate endopeptidase CwlK
MRLSATSIARLKGVHPDLVRVIKRAAAATQVPFLVVEGVRTLERQKQLLKAGATTTLNSRHITGHAVDLVPMIDGKARWDWPLYHKLAAAMKEAAKQLDVKIVCGADWKKFPDGPHFELDRKFYP